MRLIFNILIVIGCIAFVLVHLDINEIISIFTDYSPYKILLLCFWFLLSFVFLGLRLHVLKPDQLSPSLCVKASFIGHCANSFLPARIGEGVKGVYLIKNSSLSATGAMTVILWERFADLNMLFLLMLLAAKLTFPIHVFYVCCIVLIVVWGFLSWIFLQRRKDPQWHLRIKNKWLKKLIGHLSTGISASVLMRVFFFSILVWAQFLIETMLIINWIAEENLNLRALMNVFILSAIALSIPFSPGSLGTFDAALVFSLGLHGIDPNRAMAVTMLIRVIQYIPIIITAVLITLMGGKKFRNTLQLAYFTKM
jgi:uncharacterized protein (TIRG00374 family)